MPIISHFRRLRGHHWPAKRRHYVYLRSQSAATASKHDYYSTRVLPAKRAGDLYTNIADIGHKRKHTIKPMPMRKLYHADFEKRRFKMIGGRQCHDDDEPAMAYGDY